MDIYKREANSRGQVSERQPSRNAALSAAKKQRAEVEEAKRESSRARGIGKKKEKKQEKNGRVSPGIGWSSEIAIESQAAWHFPHDPWRPNRAPAPMFPSCSHVPMFIPIAQAPASLATPLPARGQVRAHQAVWGRWRLQAPGLGSGAKPLWAGAE